MIDLSNKNPQEIVNVLSVQVGRATVSIIDALLQRGAFRGEELSHLASLRDQCTVLVQNGEIVESESASE